MCCAPRPPSPPGTGHPPCLPVGQGFPPSWKQTQTRKKSWDCLHELLWKETVVSVASMLFCSPPVPPPRQDVLDRCVFLGAGRAPPAPPPLPPPPPPPLRSRAVAARPLPPQTRPLPGCWGHPRGPARRRRRPVVEEFVAGG